MKKITLLLPNALPITFLKKCILAAAAILLLQPLFAQVPAITSFAPVTGPIGTSVTISGANFDPVADSNFVYFGSVKATVTTASASSLTVTVPAGATYQPINITSHHLTAYSSFPFIVTFDAGSPILPGSFNTRQDFTGDNYTSCLFMIDIDGDNKPDIVTSNTNSNTLSVFRNVSTGSFLSFAAPVNIPTALAPISITAGDLDRDGKPDLIVTNAAGGFTSVSAFRNTTTTTTQVIDTSTIVTVSISFAPRLDVATGTSAYSSPEHALVMDFDRDGLPDVAVVNADNTVSVFRNNTQSTTIAFDTKRDFTIGPGGQSIASADLDGDGKPDLAVANSSTNTVSVLRNITTSSTITFAPKTDFTVASGCYSVAIGDLDKDGKQDIAVVSASAAVLSLLKNTSTTGNMAFNSPINYPTDNHPESVFITDIDGDSNPDIIVGSGDVNTVTTIDVFRNSGTGTLALDARASYTTSNEPNHIVVGDLNGDGFPDIVTSNGASNNISVLKSKVRAPQLTSFSPVYGGTGSTVTISGYHFSGATSVRFGNVPAASFNVISDNTITAVVGAGATGNVMVTSPYGNNVLPGFIFYTSPRITSVSPLSGPVGTTVIIDGLNFSAQATDNTVYFGSVKANVVAATATSLTVTAPSGADYKEITVAVNNQTAFSGKHFAVTFPGAPAAFLPGSFAAKKDFAITTPTAVCTGDFDGDGKIDMVSQGYYANTMSVWRNTSTNGVISFDTKIDFPTTANPNRVIACDFDCDGKLDIIVGSAFAVSVFRNTSTPNNISFAARVDLSSVGNVIATGDINLDGKPDIVAVQAGGFTILKNTSSGSTISASGQAFPVFSGGNPKGVAVGDLNDDGKPDIVVSSSSDDMLSVFTNTSSVGTLSFGGNIDYVTGDGPYDGLSIRDMNGDGKPDIVTVNYNGASVSILENKSTSAISFNLAVQFPTASSAGNFATGDLNGDGSPDIAVAHSYFSGTTLSVMKNTSNGGAPLLSANTNYVTGTAPNADAIADMDGDEKPDIVVANTGGSSISILRNTVNEPAVVPSGLSPVTGTVLQKISIDPSVLVYNGSAFVQRHYDIEPVNNPATATATITLYYTQEEFNNYNAYPIHGSDLPTGPADNANKANLRIYQYHGFSATGLPGSYSGSGVAINPDDNNIVWNALAGWWEVTFDVTGFSGFFATSAGNGVLPLQLLSFTAKGQDNTVRLQWITTNEVNVSHFEIQRGTDGTHFNALGRVDAIGSSNGNHTYNYTDASVTNVENYYRLKMTDIDGHFSYSPVAHVSLATTGAFVVLPNPARDFVVVRHPVTGTGARLLLTDMAGRVVKEVLPGKGVFQTTVDVKSVSSGMYKLIWQDGAVRISRSVVVVH